MQNSMMLLKWDSNNNKWFCQLKTRWNCDKLWKNKFCFCWFSSKPKVKFQMKKLKQQMNFIDMMIVLEKIPKKLLFLNKKEVIQNCFFFYSQNIIWISSIFVSSVPFENFDFFLINIFENFFQFQWFHFISIIFFAFFQWFLENFQAKFIIEIL